jgi:phosphoribosylformylglycinamidine (FGAM) synthase-like amidotransferase family enzyme
MISLGFSLVLLALIGISDFHFQKVTRTPNEIAAIKFLINQSVALWTSSYEQEKQITLLIAHGEGWYPSKNQQTISKYCLTTLSKTSTAHSNRSPGSVTSKKMY